MSPKDTFPAKDNNASAATDKFFEGTDLTLDETRKIVVEALAGTEYGEFYQEATESEQLVKDMGMYAVVSTGEIKSGFGFRVGQLECVGYSYSNEFNKASLKEAAGEARKTLRSGDYAVSSSFGMAPTPMYTSENPVTSMSLAEKIAKIDEIEAYLRTLDARITNATVSYTGGHKTVHVITQDGQSLTEERPMASMSVSVQVTDPVTGKTESGFAAIGGRAECKDIFNEKAYKDAGQKALRLACELLVAEPAPAGVMDVVMSPGWSAVLLHEAVGHGLEGDFNRRGTSAYSGKIGQMVANPAVTVIDQGDMRGERGSLRFDDEGTPTQKNVLIKDGVLQGYMQDRQNARLMKVTPTGNGRRQSYKDTPIPRMTNTYFAAGPNDPDDIIKSVKQGLYLSDMGGGQVDITSGRFNMNVTLAYVIRDGKLCEPVRGATITGEGLEVIKSINMVGNDLKFEKSAGSCGKEGQSVPVGVGQPTIRVSNMTVGGVKK